MSKGLSSWQRWARQAERAGERRQAAALRDRERQHAAIIRAAEQEHAANRRAAEREQVREERGRERAQLRKEREREKALEKRRKEQERAEAEHQKQVQIAEWKEEVRVSEAYVERLGHLHDRPFDLPAFERAFAGRQVRRRYVPNRFVPRKWRTASGALADESSPRYLPEPAAQPFVPVPFVDSETRRRDRVGTLLIVPAPVALLGVAAVASAGLAFAVATVIAVASVVFAFIRKRRVLLPRHELAERARFEAYTQYEEQRAAQHAQLVGEEQTRHAQRLADFRAAEVARRASFDVAEEENAARFEANETLRLGTLEACMAGDETALVAMCCAALPIDPELEYPEGFEGATMDDHWVGVIAQRGAVSLVLRAPETSIVPTKALTMSVDETKQKASRVPEKERTATYRAFLCSCSLAYAEALYEACPFLASVGVETFVPAVDPTTGETVESVLVSADYRRDVLRGVHLSKVDPEALLETLGGQIRETSKKSKPKPLSTAWDQIVWVTEGERPVDLAFGLVAGQEEWEAPNAFALAAPASEEGPLPLP